MIVIKPIKIKTGFYLLIPKIIADYYNLNYATKFELKVKNFSKPQLTYTKVSKKSKTQTKRKKTNRRYRK